MPYKGEMACRLEDPDKYKELRRKNEEQESDGKPIDVIYGILEKDGKRTSEIQALRYKTDQWKEKDAKAHCDKRKGDFEPAEVEASQFTLAFPIGKVELTAEKTIDIQLLKLGSWKHKKAPGGILEITPDLMNQFEENFNNSLAGEIPVDLEHKPKEGHSIGWIKKLWQKAGELWAKINIVDKQAQEDLKSGALKFISAQIWLDWPNPEDEKTYNIVRSAGLTNYPLLKNMAPAVVNFSEIQEFETEQTRGQRSANQLRLVENQRDQAIHGSKILLKEVKRLVDQVRLKDRKIEALKLEFDLTELLQNGQATPFELQEARACKDPVQIQFWLKRASERPKNPVGSQLSVLVPKRAKGGIGSIIELLEKEADPEKHAKILRLATEALEEQKEKRGLR